MSMSHVDEGTLHAYIDGELPPAEAQGVAEHLAHCPVCRSRVEEERALIARADQVLALARPPERDLPAFRAGARQRPVRWWQPVRVPLGWAAMVVLALGIGIYVGRAGTGRVIAPALAPSPAPFASGTPAADSVRAPTQHVPPSPRAQAAPAAPAAPVAHPVRAVARAPRQFAPSDTPARSLTRARDDVAANETIAAEAKRMGSAIGAGAGDLVLGAPLSLDSARALLDADPLAVPGLAVRAVHQGRLPGYSAVVVVEQVLDSGTTLAVITARPTVSALGEVGVAGAPPPAKATPNEGAGIARERAPDSLASRGRQSSARAVPRSDTRAAGLWLDVRGPLAADSLAALRRRLEPLRP
jgi:anti-sigma factor RsiW